MTFASPAEISDVGRGFVYESAALLAQTCVYGTYIAIITHATRIASRKHNGDALKTFMSYLPLASFTIASLYFLSSLVSHFLHIQAYIIKGVPPAERQIDYVTEFGNVCNAVVLINLIITDTIVLWRARVICRDFTRVRHLLTADLFFLVVTTLSVFCTIGLRGAETHSVLIGREDLKVKRVLNIVQVITVGASFITNVLATGTIGFRYWILRKSVKNLQFRVDKRPGSVSRTLSVLVESGFFYAISTIFNIASTGVRLPDNHQLGSWLLPVYMQVASLYPALVMIIVQQQADEDDTLYQSSKGPSSQHEAKQTEFSVAFAHAGPSEDTIVLDSLASTGDIITRFVSPKSPKVAETTSGDSSV